MVAMTTQSTARIPLGIADVSASVGYVVGKAGRILALSLTSGEVLAQTEFSATPLTVHKGTVIGWSVIRDQANALHVFAATRKGSVLEPKWREALELPVWVEVDAPEPSALALEATVEGRSIDVTWEAHSSYRGGAPPPSEIENAARHDERHTIRFDLGSGAVLARHTSQSTPSAEQALPDAGTGRRVVAYRFETSWLTQSWRVGTIEAFLAKPDSASRMVLVHRDARDRQYTNEITLTNDPAGEASVTPDGRFIFIQERGARGPAWQVFAADTGDRVSSLPFDPGTESVAVVNDRVVYLVVEHAATTARRSLRCRDLRTGEALWSHLLDEETLRAAPPPPR